MIIHHADLINYKRVFIWTENNRQRDLCWRYMFSLLRRLAIADFKSAGFVLVKDEDILPEQYYLEFRAK